MTQSRRDRRGGRTRSAGGSREERRDHRGQQRALEWESKLAGERPPDSEREGRRGGQEKADVQTQALPKLQN